MFQLPHNIDEFNESHRQMVLVHAAMYEDIEWATVGFLDETGGPEDALAMAVRSMASEAAELLVVSASSDFERAMEVSKFTAGTFAGQEQAAYRILRAGYQMVRRYGLLREDKVSKHWDQVNDYNRGLFQRDPL